MAHLLVSSQWVSGTLESFASALAVWHENNGRESVRVYLNCGAPANSSAGLPCIPPFTQSLIDALIAQGYDILVRDPQKYRGSALYVIEIMVMPPEAIPAKES